MDNVKMPFLPEETLKTQRVEIYLNDLKERLKELRLQHDEVIQNSVDIIKEIDEVSSGLLLPQNSGGCPSDNLTKIKKLIQEFETARKTNSAKPPVSFESRVDIRKILQNFEKLNDSHVLKESLVLFKRAKESLEKIDTFLGTHLENVITQSVTANKSKTGLPIKKVTTTVVELGSLTSLHVSSDNINTFANNANNTTITTMDDSVKVTNEVVPIISRPELPTCGSQISTNNSSSSLKDRINTFNKVTPPEKKSCNNPKDITPSCYASCCSSVTSMDIYQSTENVCLHSMSNGGGNSLEIGYEGDNDDSEYDLFALKRKKNKISSPNQ